MQTLFVVQICICGIDIHIHTVQQNPHMYIRINIVQQSPHMCRTLFFGYVGSCTSIQRSFVEVYIALLKIHRALWHIHRARLNIHSALLQVGCAGLFCKDIKPVYK